MKNKCNGYCEMCPDTVSLKCSHRRECLAYPKTGVLVGASLKWCLENQGDWCGDCKWRKVK